MFDLISQSLREVGEEVYAPVFKKHGHLIRNPQPVNEIDDLGEFLKDRIKAWDVDEVYPIAPDHELVEILETCEKLNLECIGPGIEAAEKAADKWQTHEILKKEGMAQPFTKLEEPVPLSELPNRKLVMKPRTGYGCQGLRLIEDSASLDEGNYMGYIFQQYLEGEHLSVTVFSTGEKSRAVSLNKQNIEFEEERFRYTGGCAPTKHPMRDELFEVAEKAVDAIPGLAPCIGVDIVVSDEKAYVLDINPRPTSSLAAVAKASNLNPGEASVSSFAGNLPRRPRFSTTECFKITKKGMVFQ